MGYATAVGFASAVSRGNIELSPAVHAHLTSNCFPPVPVCMVEPAVLAIEFCAAGETDQHVALPDGVAFRDGRTAIRADELVESLRLAAFVQVLDPLGDHC